MRAMAITAGDPSFAHLRRIPKVELHRHLECSMRHETMKELARQAGIEVPPTDAEFKKRFLVTEPMRDLEAVLLKFLLIQKVLRTEEILTRITFEAIEDAFHEGIRILELRYAPTYIRQGHENLSFDRIHAAISKGVEKAKHLPIAVGLMVIVQRTLPLADANDVTDFAIAHRDEILALDLADNEVGFDQRPFAPLFLRAKKAGLHVTVHAGESDVPEAPGYVRDAIEHLGAERIGHGVQIYKSDEVMKFVADRRVPLELCPTSNWLTNAVASTAAHPFRRLMENGVLVTLNSDDPGVFDLDLVNEYGVLEREQHFTAVDFDRINDTAATASFIPLAEKQKHWPRPILPRL
jgi:adenosine deaminase